MSKTTVEISFRRYLESIKLDLVAKFQYMLGFIFAKLSESHEQYKSHVLHSSMSQNGPLSKKEVLEMIKWQEGNGGEASVKKRSALLFKHEMLEAPWATLLMQHKVTRLVYETLSKYKSDIKTVANIGARVDTASQYLAEKFPDKTFVSVDFQSNLEQINSYFPKLKNRQYLSGYVLDLLKAGDLKADLIFMTSTAILLKNKEFDEMLDEIQKSTKYIVLNEPWSPKLTSFNIFSINKPEKVDVNAPYCAGPHFVVHHNFIKKLEAKGYVIELSRIVDGHKPASLTLQIIAKKDF